MREEEIFFTWEDVKRLMQKLKPQLKRIALWSALSIFAIVVFQEPRFRATATIRNFTQFEDRVGDLKSVFLGPLGLEKDDGTATLMQSQRLGRTVIEKLGLQMQVKERGFILQKLSNLWRNINAELRWRNKDLQHFSFRDAFFDGEEALSFFLRFAEGGEFELLSRKKELLGKGKIGAPFVHQQLQFTMEKTPSNLSFKKLYPLTPLPWHGVVQKHLKHLAVKPHKNDKKMLRLFFSDSCRQRAALFLDEMIAAYQEFMKKENEDRAEAELSYLEERQQELCRKLDRVLEEQAGYLKQSLAEDGFASFSQELEMLSIPKQAYTNKLFDLEFEQRRLEKKTQLETPVTRELHNRLTNIQLQEAKIEAPQDKLAMPEVPHLDLVTAQQLNTSYQAQKEEIQNGIKQLLQVKDQIHLPEFELSSLGTVLKDAVGQGMVQKAAEIALQLRDEKNYSLKEIERLKEALETEKNFLVSRIEQIVELERQRTKILEEKISSLQVVSLDLIKKEKQLIEKKLMDLSEKMQDLPEKWKRENRLQFEKELRMGIIEGISKIVESKNLHFNLFRADSKQIDQAIPPLLPERPLLLLFAIGGAFFASSSFFLCRVVQSALRGFPLSKESLTHYGLTFGGTLTQYADTALAELSDGDLRTLRALANFVSTHALKTVVYIGGSSPDVCVNLAQLLAMQKKRVLLISAAFDKIVHPQEGAGLWHYLENDEMPELQRRGEFDFLPCGGTSKHMPELLSRAAFAELLRAFESEYECILIYSSAKPALSEAHTFFKYADAMIVALKEERAVEIAPYKIWSEKEKRPLMFVCGGQG